MNAVFTNVSKSHTDPTDDRSHHAWKISLSKLNDFDILVEVAENKIVEIRWILNGYIQPARTGDFDTDRVNFASVPLPKSDDMFTANIYKRIQAAFTSPTNYVVKQVYGI